MRDNCKCCGRNLDLRLGFCFDCVEAESLLVDGTDMYDETPPKVEGLSSAMSILQRILRRYIHINSPYIPNGKVK